MAETLTDSKVGKLQSVGHFVSTARGSLAFDASAPFGADFVCCAPCFSVLTLVLHGASVYFCAVENAALYLAYSAENDALAAGTVFLAAGIPAAAAGNLAAAASAVFETENWVVTFCFILAKIISITIEIILCQVPVHLVRQECREGSTLGLTGLSQEAMLCLPHHHHHSHHQQRRHPVHHCPHNIYHTALTTTAGQNPGIDCVSLLACPSLIPFFLLLPLFCSYRGAQCKSLHSACYTLHTAMYILKNCHNTETNCQLNNKQGCMGKWVVRFDM